MNWLKKKSVLVPIDLGTKSETAVDTALETVDSPGSVHTVYVAPDITIMEPGVVWGEITDESRQRHLEDEFKKRFADEKYSQVDFHVAFGDAGHCIVEYAEEIGAGLIVMPSHGRTGLSRLLIGSVAERVLRLAHCPVLILRE